MKHQWVVSISCFVLCSAVSRRFCILLGNKKAIPNVWSLNIVKGLYYHSNCLFSSHYSLLLYFGIYSHSFFSTHFGYHVRFPDQQHIHRVGITNDCFIRIFDAKIQNCIPLGEQHPCIPWLLSLPCHLWDIPRSIIIRTATLNEGFGIRVLLSSFTLNAWFLNCRNDKHWGIH